MKFEINKDLLGEAVLNIQRVVSTKTSIPALEGILITARENMVELSAYDLELGMTTQIPANVIREGKTVISAKAFPNIVRRTPKEIITVEVDEHNMASIESGESQFSIICIPAEEFPEFPKISEATKIEIDLSTLKSVIKQTIFAVAESDAKPIHQGSLFDIKDGILDVVSVDGYRLAKRTEPINTQENLSFVVPGKTLHEILRLLTDDEGTVEIFAGKRQIMFKINDYVVISSLLEGEFLNYQKAIPTNFTTRALIKTRSAIESVDRVSLLITDRLKSPVRCTFTNNKMGLLCTTSMGSAKDSINVEIEGNDLEIGFNNRYLLEALRNTETDEVCIKLGGPLNPMVITGKDDESFVFLVLPVRLKSE